jgi:hypothetical protein
MATDISPTLTQTIDKLLQIILSFPSEKFNTIPFAGSWTAAQVCDHVLKSVSGVHEMLYSKAEPTTRQAEEKKEAISNMFLDFVTKMKSPEFILPRNEPLDKNQVVSAFEELKSKLTEAINRLDLTQACTVFELPGFGPFTRVEWIWFAVYHTQRHTHQLTNIFEVMSHKKQAAV